MRALSVSLILILSSLAGCLADDEKTTSDIELENENYGTVMVSTYHVGQLVSAVAGDSVTIEYMSQDNIPVHDYEPSASDLIRLQQADLFFYHGLNLEPWVESTLSSLGDDAPPSYMTHAMPTGESALDYESMLVSNLCEYISEGPYESTTLVMEEGALPELHAENVAHSLHFPEEMDEDDHDEDDHDEDDHDEDEMTPEMALEMFDINDDGNLSWDEFWASWEEDGDDDDNGHGDHDDDHEAEMSALMHIFNESDMNSNELLDQSELGGFIHEVMEFDEGDHDEHGHAEPENIIESPDACPANTVISIFHMEEGEYTLEFISEEGNPFNMVTQKMGGGHAHGHDDHDDHSDEGDDHDGDYCHNTTTHENYDSNEADCEAAGHVWMEDDDGHNDSEMVCYDMNSHTINETYISQENCEDAGLMWTAAEGESSGHDDEHGDYCHNTTTHENYDSNEDDCEAAGHVWMEEDHSDEHEGHFGYATIHIESEGDYGFALPIDVGFFILMDEVGHDGHDHGDHDEDDHDEDDHDEDDHDEDNHDEDDHDEDNHDEDNHDEDDHDEDDHDDEIHADEDEEVFMYDPHSWLNPLAFEVQLSVVLDTLVLTFPNGSTLFNTNAVAYSAQLQALDTGFSDAFGEDGACFAAGSEKTIIANHNAYSYLTVKYDIEVISLHGLDPEGEPSPEDIAEVIEHINEEGISVLFVEEFTDQGAVDSIVQETGVTIKVLYTMEISPSDINDDYISMMDKNLENLVSGIGC